MINKKIETQKIKSERSFSNKNSHQNSDHNSQSSFSQRQLFIPKINTQLNQIAQIPQINQLSPMSQYYYQPNSLYPESHSTSDKHSSNLEINYFIDSLTSCIYDEVKKSISFHIHEDKLFSEENMKETLLSIKQRFEKPGYHTDQIEKELVKGVNLLKEEVVLYLNRFKSRMDYENGFLQRRVINKMKDLERLEVFLSDYEKSYNENNNHEISERIVRLNNSLNEIKTIKNNKLINENNENSEDNENLFEKEIDFYIEKMTFFLEEYIVIKMKKINVVSNQISMQFLSEKCNKEIDERMRFERKIRNPILIFNDYEKKRKKLK